MSQDSFQVAAIQMNCKARDRDTNVARALELITEAARDGAKMMVLPELFTSGYYCFRARDPTLFEEAETIPGPTTTAIGEIAKKYKIHVVAPIFEKTKMGVYFNSSPLIGPDGKVIGKYSKTHIPLSQGVPEKYYFRPGSEFPVFKTGLGNIGIITCYDRIFPEAFRILALKGAEIMAVPSTIYPNVEAKVSEDWEYIARARAKENGVFAIFVNRSGEEEGLKYFGNSLIVGPSGKIIAKAGFEESVVTATVNLVDVEQGRTRRFYMRDRRPEIYSRLVEQ